ncbi:MAG TPA: FAD-dependent oxidoreductase [Micromonosporaceae bacterium]
MNPRSFDVIVVGNGVIGLSVALAIAEEQPSASIAVVGPSNRPFGATPAAGAMLGCFGEVTTTTLGSPYGRRKFELALAARKMWPAWFDRMGAEPSQIMTTKETVVLLNTVGFSEVDSANFAAIRQALREAGEPYEEIAVEDIEWLVSDSNARPLRALRLPDEGAVDTAALLTTLTTALEKRGVTFIHEAATGLRVRSGRAEGVQLADSVVTAGTVVVAAGAASEPLIRSVPELTYRVPKVIGGCGVSVLVDTADGTVPPYVLRTPNRAFACGLHVLPRSAGTVYVGATNEVTFDPRQEVTISEFIFLTDCAVRQIRRDLNSGHIRQIQIGNRPMSIDGWPLIGATSLDGLWIVTGTYRDGLHLSPLLARHIAKQISGDAGLAGLEEFRPEREPISAPSRAEVLDEVVRHTLATGFEGPWFVNPDWPPAIGKFARTSFERLLDELGGAYLPPPEVMSVLLKSTDDDVARLRSYYEAVHAAWH